MNYVRSQQDLKILPAYKNLGPMVANRDDHVKAMAVQRVSDRNIYEIITKKEVEEPLLESTEAFLRFCSSKGNSIDHKDLTYV